MEEAEEDGNLKTTASVEAQGGGCEVGGTTVPTFSRNPDCPPNHCQAPVFHHDRDTQPSFSGNAIYVFNTIIFIIYNSKNERKKPFLLKADFGVLVLNITLRIVMLVQKM